MNNEADTRRHYITLQLIAAGRDDPPHSFTEEYTINPGRILANGARRPQRQPPRRADYLLRYNHDIALAVVEAKAEEHPACDGLQQAKD